MDPDERRLAYVRLIGRMESVLRAADAALVVASKEVNAAFRLEEILHARREIHIILAESDALFKPME